MKRDQRDEEAARTVGRGGKQPRQAAQLTRIAPQEHICSGCHVEAVICDRVAERLAWPPFL